MLRRELEAALEAIPRHPNPRADLEQYRTPPGIAAGLLWLAREEGAITHKRVLDLGSGTGMFAVGAALLEATLATGVEVDPVASEMAQQAATLAGVAKRTWFVSSSLEGWRADPGLFDTVVMNPPFGAQKANKHADRLFFERAVQAVKPHGTVWFLALERTEKFLGAMAKESKARIDKVASWDYPLEATMPHHEREVALVRVGGYRLAWI